MLKRLPSRPSLEHLKKEAKQLLKSYRTGGRRAHERLSVLPKVRKHTKGPSPRVSLQDTQHVLGVEYGWGDWASLKHIVTITSNAPQLVRPGRATHKELLAFFRNRVSVSTQEVVYLERRTPPVPSQFAVARDSESNIEGVVFLENFPHGWHVGLTVDSGHVVPALLAHVDPGYPYGFGIDARYREALLQRLHSTSEHSEYWYLQLAARDLRIHATHGDVRRLTTADLPLAEDFPPLPRDTHEPPLATCLRWAAGSQTRLVHGVVDAGRIASYVTFDHDTGALWSVGVLRCREDCQGKGYERAVLSHICAALLRESRIPSDDARTTRTEYLQLLQDVGFKPVSKHFGCKGRLKV